MASALDEKVLQAMFDTAQKSGGEKMKFSVEEASRFRKAFADPEFRKMFAEYMDELQDPKNREETEAYITQLEGEQKVPEGKELIRPLPGFVAKTHKKIEGNENSSKDKVFLNLVQSEKIALPTKTPSSKGDYWSVPYSLGPPHMEKDKKGDNATCFDCCFHPEALRLGEKSADFKTLLVNTAIEGVEEFYKRNSQKVQLEHQFHIVKGLAYKEGNVPTMLIAVSSKENWKSSGGANGNGNVQKITSGEKDSLSSSSSKKKEPSSGMKLRADPPSSTSDDEKSPCPSPTNANTNNGDKSTDFKSITAADSKTSDSATSVSTAKSTEATKKETQVPSSSSAKSGTKVVSSGLRRGFLNSSKSSLYPEKIPTIRPKNTQEDAAIGVDKDPSLAETMSEEESRLSSMLKSESVTPKNVLEDSMKVVSSKMKAKPTSESTPDTSITESVDNAKKDKVASSGSSSSAGPQEPAVICKHRDAVSLGDFENNKGMVPSNRPTELVYEIQLPLVTAPAKIVLDVSEKKLLLTYLEVYKLDLTLPYKVVDKKGKASYDKTKKVLRVTLPVEIVSATSVSAEKSKELVTETVSEIKETKEEENVESPSPKKAAIPSPAKKEKGKEHNRWVGKEVNDTTKVAEDDEDEAEKESKKLFEEVQRHAELAKQAALEKKAAAAASSDSAVMSSVVKPAPVIVTTISEPTDNFMAAESFQGRKAGYVFRRGDAGLGYYLDTPIFVTEPTINPAIATLSTLKKSTTIPSVKPIHYQIPEYRLQQTKEAISILFEVPHILFDSVQLQVQKYNLQISFQALGTSTELNRETAQNGVEKITYGVVLTLNPAIVGEGWKAEKMQYDVAKKNMVVVILKEKNGIWCDPIHPEQTEASIWLSSSKLIPAEQQQEQQPPPPQETDKTNESTQDTKKTSEDSKTMETLQSMLSTMQFTTDILSELD